MHLYDSDHKYTVIRILISRLETSTNDLVCLMVFNATFNNITIISWQSMIQIQH